MRHQQTRKIRRYAFVELASHLDPVAARGGPNTSRRMHQPIPSQQNPPHVPSEHTIQVVPHAQSLLPVLPEAAQRRASPWRQSPHRSRSGGLPWMLSRLVADSGRRRTASLGRRWVSYSRSSARWQWTNAAQPTLPPRRRHCTSAHPCGSQPTTPEAPMLAF